MKRCVGLIAMYFNEPCESCPEFYADISHFLLVNSENTCYGKNSRTKADFNPSARYVQVVSVQCNPKVKLRQSKFRFLEGVMGSPT
jgi:hypothetical protein